jgi:hypothetical protein
MLRGKEFSLNLALYRLCSCYTNLVIYLRHGVFPLQSHPGGLLFTKFGSNQTALLDLAFPVTLSLPTTFFFCIFV